MRNTVIQIEQTNKKLSDICYLENSINKSDIQLQYVILMITNVQVIGKTNASLA